MKPGKTCGFSPAGKCPRDLANGRRVPLFPILSLVRILRAPCKSWGRAFPAAVTGSDACISREERRASLGGPEPAWEQWRNLRPPALPPHGAAPGAAAGRGRALGDAGAAGHRRLWERLPVPASGEVGRERERRWVFVRASVEQSDCQYVRDRQ